MNTTDGDTMANISAEVSGNGNGVGVGGTGVEVGGGEVWVGGGTGETLIDFGVGVFGVGGDVVATPAAGDG